MDHDHQQHDDGLARAIEKFRREKDGFFRGSPDSPVPPAERGGFRGLSYFPVDPALRFVGLHLVPYEGSDAPDFAISTSDGRRRPARRTGALRFAVEGRDLALAAYAMPAGETGSLFVPFRDDTSGTDTYGAGRYLDLEPERDGTYVLDFNLAYNPYCAYSESYSCPLPPRENWLDASIEAGEQLPGGHA